MTLKIFKGGELYEEGERSQLLDLLDLVDTYFDERGSNVYLVIDPKTYESLQIDSIFYRQNKVVLLELKNIHGKFKPTSDYVKLWTSIHKDGTETTIKKEKINPFLQVKKQRSRLIRYLMENVYGNSDQDEEIAKRLGDVIDGWIVTAKDSQPIEYDWSEYWRRVVPIGNELKRSLSTVGTSRKNGITEEKFLEFLKKTGSIETNRDDVLLRGVAPIYDKDRVSSVELRLRSKQDEEILSALRYCSELHLITYFDLVKKVSYNHSARVRARAFSVLFKWLSNFRTKFSTKDAEEVTEMGLMDRETEVKKLTLQFLTNYPSKVGGRLMTLIWDNLQSEKSPSMIELYLESLEFVEDKKFAAEKLKTYYYEYVRKGFFGWGENYYKLLKDLKEGSQESQISEDREGEELSRAQAQFGIWTKIVRAWIKPAVATNQSILWDAITDHLNLVMKILQKDEYNHRLAPTLSESIDAIGAMHPAGGADLLLDFLSSTSNNEVKLCLIRGLGELRSAESLTQLKAFLNASAKLDDDYVEEIRIAASEAISKIGDKGSFDRIFGLFVRSIKNRWSWPERNPYYLSLRKLDGQKLENYLWRILEKRDYEEESLAKYGEFITECGGKYSFDKCKQLIKEGRGGTTGGWFWEPSNMIISIAFSGNFPGMRELGINTGLQFLETGRKELLDVGMELSEPYFIEHPEELVSIERKSAEAKYVAVSVYQTLRMQDKIESFIPGESINFQEHILYVLEKMNPGNSFKGFLLIGGKQAHDSEFFVGSTGILFRTYNTEGMNRIVVNESMKFIEMRNIIFIYKIQLNSRDIGLLIGTKNENENYYALIPDETMTRGYLNNEAAITSNDLEHVLYLIAKGIRSPKELMKVTPSNEFVFDIIRLAYNRNLTESLEGQDSEWAKERTEEFENKFKAEMVQLREIRSASS